MTFPNGEVWEHKDTVSKRFLHKTPSIKDKGKEESEEECYVVTVKARSSEDKGQDTKIEDHAQELLPLLTEYDDLFQPLSGVPPEGRIQHEIHLLPGATPIMKRPYRLLEPQALEIQKQMEKALEEGWIQPSFSPWGTAIFIVGKKNGEWRMCVDYHDLNALTE